MENLAWEVCTVGLPTQILQVELPLSDSLVQRICNSIDKIGDEKDRKTNVKAVMTSYYSHLEHYDEFSEIYEYIAAIIRDLPQTENFRKGLGDQAMLLVNDFWGARYEGADHAIAHEHNPAFMSFVLFLDVEDNPCPLLITESTLFNEQSLTPPELQGFRFEIPATNNKLVVFQGHVSHKVEAFPESDGKGKRYVLAGNLNHALFLGASRMYVIEKTLQMYSNVYPRLEEWRNTVFYPFLREERPPPEIKFTV